MFNIGIPRDRRGFRPVEIRLKGLVSSKRKDGVWHKITRAKKYSILKNLV